MQLSSFGAAKPRKGCGILPKVRVQAYLLPPARSPKLVHMNQDTESMNEGSDQEISQTLSDKLKTFQQSAIQWQQRATETTRRAAQATDEYVRDNPWTAVATVGSRATRSAA